MEKPKRPQDTEQNEGRRKFLKGLGVATAAAAGIAVTKTKEGQAAPKTAAAAPPPTLPALPAVERGQENVLLRMQREVQQALKKPLEDRRWVMVIDLAKCIGCMACTVACKAENLLPPGVVYRPVLEEEIGKYPNVSRRFTPRPCMQCAEPPCVPVCPVNATYKRPDGVIEVNYDQCIGCRYCIPACPYGARYFDFGEDYTGDAPGGTQPYETAPSPEYGQSWTRKEGQSPVGNVRKCQFCLHRLNAGMLPACVSTCMGEATYFGDASDPRSVVAELISSPRVMRLKVELGTEPQTYYLV